MDKFSFLNNSDPGYIEKLYRDYLSDPSKVDNSWRQFFEGFEFARHDYGDNTDQNDLYPTEFKVINLINAYRQRGHLFTKTNPVRTRRKYEPTLDIENFDLDSDDLNKTFQAGKEIGIGAATLSDILKHLNDTYRQAIGVEFMYIRKPEIRNWLMNKMESDKNTPSFSTEEKMSILKKISQAVLFEKFIHKKFPGQKRFSLEGAESLIPAFNTLINSGVEMGISEYVIGMAHRGRLNVLANIMGKPHERIFHEFEGSEYDEEFLLGDVKYHLGYTATIKTNAAKDVKITLSPNPSHLEAVDPVVEGIARAKIDQDHKGDFKRLAPVLIHGDASVSGQGVIYELLQMSELPAYKTGGTIHIVINNQLGFTTNYLEGRSSTYCTDVGKTTLSPVFHVNGDDVEAVAHTIKLAAEFRQKFHKDVFIDLLCYRKYGHNEGDEPRFTQPILYKIIEKHPDPLKIYKEKLIKENILEENTIKEKADQINKALEETLEKSKNIEKAHISSIMKDKWSSIDKASESHFDVSPETAVPKEKLFEMARVISSIPEDEKIFRKLNRLQEERWKMVEDGKNLDWAMGELLAYASLLDEGVSVRLSGQDSERGTFSHRHAVLKVENSEQKYVPLNHISRSQARLQIYNSPLSEYAVLGFEYGYSLASPFTLTIWEAQFGDFVNGAQIIIDQFISSAEDKWNVMNDLVMYLPHGYEGQGPEHSSGRMERFLALCAENNMQIVNCTSPANLFHVLRRQLKRDIRKPLIIFTPKSLLRHPKCTSPIEDFAEGRFKEVINDNIEKEIVERLIFCTGKIYYDLLAHRDKGNAGNTAIIRLEQVYPLPEKILESIIDSYPNAKEFLWVQEEPVNMGAWPFISQNFDYKKLRVLARPASGSTATGSSKFHKIRQTKILEKAFGECDCPLVKDVCKMICIGNRWKSFEEQIRKADGNEISSKSVSAEKKLQ